MIDRIRQDIQDRLEQLLAEAERLRQALHALGGSSPSSQGTARAPRATRASRNGTSSSDPGSASGSSSGSGSSSSSRSGSRSGAATRRRGGTSTRTRGAAGGTKNAVLKALEDAAGAALTASEVANATGLGRASVSTTLSKLARTGEVEKADRGYRLGGSSSGAEAAAGSADSEA